MFSYRPPKRSSWGHSIGSKDPLEARKELDAFFDTYFERVEPQSSQPLILAWKSSVLPNIDWPEELLQPESQPFQHVMVVVMGNRVSFPVGILFPISPTEPASYQFLGRFSANAPFKMSPQHFKVGVLCKNGKVALRKPDAEIAAKLKECIV
jgi:hypothetical protein